MTGVTVIGTGYLGATHAAALAALGHDVIGIDTDADKVSALNDGRPPFYEPGLAEMVASQVASGALRFTTSFEDAADRDFHFLCVGTPQQLGSEAADLTFLESAVDSLAPFVGPSALVVGKSTVPVGTARALAQRLQARSPAGPAARLVWNPEFLREGHAVEDALHPDRIVVGVDDPADGDLLAKVYEAQLADGCPYLVTDLATAELVKSAANSFLATKISFINAMADVCEASGANVTDLARALGHDERIGPRFLRAGIGFGGGCLPKDLRAFTARADELGVGRSLSILRAVDQINMRRRGRVVEMCVEMLDGSALGARVAVLGVAFKPDSDDVRDSPALNIAAALHLQGARVSVYDPKAMSNAARSFPTLTYVPDVESVLDRADLTLLLTEWSEFKELDPAAARRLVRRPVVLDGRNALDEAAWRAGGWTYRGVGR